MPATKPVARTLGADRANLPRCLRLCKVAHRLAAREEAEPVRAVNCVAYLANAAILRESNVESFAAERVFSTKSAIAAMTNGRIN